MIKKQKYIIYATTYNDYSGGAIVLHKLCDILNRCGQKAFIWPYAKPLSLSDNLIKYLVIKIKDFIKYLKFGSPTIQLNTPLATKSDLIDAIVIYPETVSGNPLRSSQVVRWFLNKPGFITGEIEFGDNELYFYFQDVFNDMDINEDLGNKLTILDYRDDIYHQQNFGRRNGRCFILRKGKDRKPVHNIKKSEIVDHFNHRKLAEIFNKVEYCYSYDMHSMYSVYASWCGCKSIIVPDENISVDEWQPIKELRYGVAYGDQDIDRAISTRDKMFEYQKNKEQESLESVNNFIKKTLTFFNGD